MRLLAQILTPLTWLYGKVGVPFPVVSLIAVMVVCALLGMWLWGVAGDQYKKQETAAMAEKLAINVTNNSGVVAGSIGQVIMNPASAATPKNTQPPPLGIKTVSATDGGDNNSVIDIELFNYLKDESIIMLNPVISIDRLRWKAQLTDGETEIMPGVRFYHALMKPKSQDIGTGSIFPTSDVIKDIYSGSRGITIVLHFKDKSNQWFSKTSKWKSFDGHILEQPGTITKAESGPPKIDDQ